MTDHTDPVDQAERIRRLQERRAASGRAPRSVPAASATRAAPVAAESALPAGAPARVARPRRRHPAAASRWLAGGLSVASFFAIAGTVAAADLNAASTPAATPAATQAATPAPTAATAPAAAPAVSASATPAPTAPAPTKAASVPAPAAPARHTTTRGS